MARYFGSKSLGHIITASLRRSLSLTVSKLRDLMLSEMWLYFLRPNTIRATKFCTIIEPLLLCLQPTVLVARAPTDCMRKLMMKDLKKFFKDKDLI